ncbi:hypothetical protein, partial [Nocardia sp. NPDC005745]|uniref:hypothetical protein n=1 Tax=Nocardia sp. NPDC005745 TaxID=3157061 RepID=UPI0033EFB991
LSKATGLTLPATLVFDHPTPTAVATYLKTHIQPAAASGSSRRGAGEKSLVEGLDKIESLITALAANNQVEGHVEQRLRSFGLKLNALLAGIEDWDDDEQAEDLASASDDELFEALSNELDSSSSAGTASYDGRA